MRHILLLTLLLLPSPVSAETLTPSHDNIYFSIYSDNDLFGSTGENYTAGWV